MSASPAGHSTMSSALPEAVNYHTWLGDLVCGWIGPGPLLEIGPGYGQYTPRFAAMTERVLAVDIDQACVDHVRSLGGNIDAITADIGTPSPDPRIGEGVWQSVVCLNMLEHAEQDLAVLGHIRRWLAPGGRLVLVLPAHQALYGPMDQMAGHYRRYSRHDILAKFTAAGLKNLHTSYLNPLGGLGWWINAKFCRPDDLSAPGINRQILLFDRYVLPLSRLCTPLTSRLFGQSLLAVAERVSTE